MTSPTLPLPFRFSSVSPLPAQLYTIVSCTAHFQGRAQLLILPTPSFGPMGHAVRMPNTAPLRSDGRATKKASIGDRSNRDGLPAAPIEGPMRWLPSVMTRFSILSAAVNRSRREDGPANCGSARRCGGGRGQKNTKVPGTAESARHLIAPREPATRRSQ